MVIVVAGSHTIEGDGEDSTTPIKYTKFWSK